MSQTRNHLEDDSNSPARAQAELARVDPRDYEARIEDNDELSTELCRFHGVGEKIAACVMLFGFGKLDAFPVDVWIERTLREHYGASIGEKASLQRLREFARAHFGPYGGYAQQFLFHHARCAEG